MTRSAISRRLLRKVTRRPPFWTGGLVLCGSLIITAACSTGDRVTALRRPALDVSHAAGSFEFTMLASLGDFAPGGGNFSNDFETYGLNNRGVASFVTEVSVGGAVTSSGSSEGLFLARPGEIAQVARFGQPAPGGGTFGPGILGSTPINDRGEVAFAYQLLPATFPLGTNSGLYRFAGKRGGVTAVVVPGSTPAPGGGVFQGVAFDPTLNNRGDIAFDGVVPAGDGVFTADRHGQISTVAQPGDSAPGGTFVDAVSGSINDAGDVAFVGLIAGGYPGVYVKRAATGEIQSIAQRGEPAPGGGTYVSAYGPMINNRGEIAFVGEFAFRTAGLFLRSAQGVVESVVRPGDPLPGGGNLAFVRGGSEYLHLNNAGAVLFLAHLDTGGGRLYVSSGDDLRFVADTGDVIPGAGTIVGPFTAGALNDHGEVFFATKVRDADGVALGSGPGKTIPSVRWVSSFQKEVCLDRKEACYRR